MSSPQAELFTRRLRDATKSIHDVSDHMVNLKLGVAMSDDSVWAEGLLVFYEVFRFLEGAVQRTKDSLLGEYNLIAGLWRTEVRFHHFFNSKRIMLISVHDERGIVS